MEEPVSELERKLPKALEIKEVLEHILGFCKITGLKSCRLVSTFFRECSVKAFKSFPVKLTSSSKTREFIRFLNDPRPVSGSRAALYTNFILSSSSLAISRQSAAFWAFTGSQIKSLELSNIKLENVDEFRNIVLNICLNLKELILRNMSITSPSNVTINEPKEWEAPRHGVNHAVRRLTINQPPGSLGISWMELVNYFPSMKALILEEALPIHEDLFHSMEVTREHNASLMDLNEIHFWYADQQTAGQQNKLNELFLGVVGLTNTNLQLKKLSIDLRGEAEAEYAYFTNLLLKGLLKTQENSLEILKIRRNMGRNLYTLRFLRPPNLIHLQDLDLQSPVFRSMWILKFTPNLRSLSFSQPNLSDDDDDLRSRVLDGFQLTKCVKLNVNCKISLEGLELLFKLVPNVERLKMMGLDNDMFTLICERWPKLVELDIVDSRVDECGIAGMDEEDVKKVNDLRGLSEWRPNTEPRANITNLKHLRKLSMQAAPPSSGVPFNNLLGYCGKLYGFEKLSSLEDISIVNYAFEKRAYKDILVGIQRVRIRISPPPPPNDNLGRIDGV